MRRLALLAVIGLGFLGVVMSHDALTAQPEKQLICHVTGNGEAHIISVSQSAVRAHLEKHGDCLINATADSLVGIACQSTDANNNDICDVQP
jgi:hypothetical protein